MLSGKYFDDCFSTLSPPGKGLLPFFHCAEAIDLRAVLEIGKLVPSDCPVFTGEKLLYLSYGKPGYRSRNSDTNTNLRYFLPVIFIVDPNCVQNIKRIFPFDSGGFQYYGDFMHSKMTLDNFLITPNIDAVNKTVRYFFGDDKQYFDGYGKKEIDYDPIHFPVEAYQNLILNNGKQRQDDRKSSIEVQIESIIPISNKTIHGIIMPEDYAASDYVQQKTQQYQVKVIPYRTRHGLASSDYYFHLLEIVREFLKNKGVL